MHLLEVDKLGLGGISMILGFSLGSGSQVLRAPLRRLFTAGLGLGLRPLPPPDSSPVRSLSTHLPVLLVNIEPLNTLAEVGLLCLCGLELLFELGLEFAR